MLLYHPKDVDVDCKFLTLFRELKKTISRKGEFQLDIERACLEMAENRGGERDRDTAYPPQVSAVDISRAQYIGQEKMRFSA